MRPQRASLYAKGMSQQILWCARCRTAITFTGGLSSGPSSGDVWGKG
jgi:hypothetical protein